MTVKETTEKVKTAQSFKELRELLSSITATPTLCYTLDEPENWNDLYYYSRQAYGRLRREALAINPKADIKNVPLEWDIGTLTDLCVDAEIAIDQRDEPKQGKKRANKLLEKHIKEAQEELFNSTDPEYIARWITIHYPEYHAPKAETITRTMSRMKKKAKIN